MKTALITGINGMDGSHLADFLLEKDYIIYGMERRTSYPNRLNTKHLEGKVTFVSLSPSRISVSHRSAWLPEASGAIVSVSSVTSMGSQITSGEGARVQGLGSVRGIFCSLSKGSVWLPQS